MLAPGLCGISSEGAALSDPTTKQANLDEHSLTEEIKKEKIRRAMLAGPSVVTAEAIVAEMDRQGNLTVLRHAQTSGSVFPATKTLSEREIWLLIQWAWFGSRTFLPENQSPRIALQV